MNPGMSFISSTLTLSVYGIGAIIINQATARATRLTLFSNMIVFSSYAMQVILGFLLLSIIFILLPRVTVSVGRINQVLDVEPSISSPSKHQATKGAGTIEFKNVSFRYPQAEADAVHNLSFQAKQGQTIAIIGSTGSGKSSVMNLIPRLYDVTKGQVLIDGVDVKDYSTAELNDRLGYIPQKAVLFSGSIRSNISFGETDKQASQNDQDIYQALEIAQSRDFVDQKQHKLDSEVAQHGDNFSGGQKQRLAIARAIARKPEILLFDDSFSALDYETDRKLRGALKTKAAQTTKVIVAQRISTIMDADQIIVLDNGKVAGQGTHSELLKNNEVYQEIAYSQLSKEELA